MSWRSTATTAIASRLAGAVGHRLQAQQAFHLRWVQRAGMRTHGGRPLLSSAGVSGSGFHKKQPSAGRVTAHSNK
eukprot:8925683-Pyramimonas_sp.AAC.1